MNKYIKITEQNNHISLLQINRPEVKNALNDELISELADILINNPLNSKCFVLTGNNKFFAAGGDIKEMSQLSYADVSNQNYVSQAWDKLERRTLPLIAAVHGFAIGGGCELALHCDIIVAGYSAVFAQPEVQLGIIPGAGGTQRLTRIIGKAKAMEMVLTGRQMGAIEAEQCGLISKVVNDEDVITEAMNIANKITSLSKPVINLARQAVNNAYETNLQVGMKMERQMLYSTFALADNKEGLNAFIEKRSANWSDK